MLKGIILFIVLSLSSSLIVKNIVGSVTKLNNANSVPVTFDDVVLKPQKLVYIKANIDNVYTNLGG